MPFAAMHRDKSEQPTSYCLHPATQADADFLWCVTAVTMREYLAEVGAWDEDFQKWHFRCKFDPARWCVVVVDGSDAGGYAIDRHPQAQFLTDLYLMPEFQGQGIGSSILGSLIAEARSAGVPLFVQVLDSNPRARRHYERHGFTYVSPLPLPHYSLLVAQP